VNNPVDRLWKTIDHTVNTAAVMLWITALRSCEQSLYVRGMIVQPNIAFGEDTLWIAETPAKKAALSGFEVAMSVVIGAVCMVIAMFGILAWDFRG
jgi:hypothetical protein